MKIAFAFGASMFLASAFLAVLGWLLSTRVSRVRHWPAFWAMLLCTALVIPLLSLAFESLSTSIPLHIIDVAYLHAPMDAIEWLVAEQHPESGSLASTIRNLLVTALGAIYFFGVVISLTQLAIGRDRARSIAMNAQPAIHSSGTRIWITAEDTAPFAFTPFGRRDASKILISQRFMREFSATELADVVAHESRHIERHDDEWGLFLRVVLACCWISPFAQGLFSRWLESVEIQCDRAVTSNRIPENRRAYAETLLKAFRITANRVLQYPVASFSTRHLRSEKMRIEQILNGNSPTFKQFRHYLILLASAIIVAAAGAMLMSPVATADTSNDKVGATKGIGALLNGRLSSPYGMVGDPFNRGEMRMHYGVDVAAMTGTPILAPADSVVVVATNLYDGNPKYGKVVVIKTDNNVSILLAHLDSYSVIPGQRIRKGVEIATVGNTGQSSIPHVHIETVKSGERVDPLTVLPILNLQQI